MTLPASIQYIDAKARVVRSINRVTSFVKASTEFGKDTANVGKRAKIKQMLFELKDIRRCVEDDIQIMESAVGSSTAPCDVIDNTCSTSLMDKFDSLYYELAAFSDVHNFALSSPHGNTSAVVQPANQSASVNNLSSFQLPKRKFPTFSGVLTEWQGFEDLFNSILSHVPDLPQVEKFEYLKTSLEGEPLSLIAHLALTSDNYERAWKILKARYGNKRDLARIHLDALLAPHVVKSTDASSIKSLINSILEHTAALDNLDFTSRQWSPILIHIFEKHLDYNLHSRWELTVGDRHLPQITEFVDFLRSHVRSAEIHSEKPSFSSNNVTNRSKPNHKPVHSHFRSPVLQKVLAAQTAEPFKSSCPLCKQSHGIRKCSLFMSKSPTERFQMAKTHQLCINCLGKGHTAASCPSQVKCKTCDRTHHTLLHFGPSTQPSLLVTNNPVSTASTSEPNASTLTVRGQPQTSVLLSTVLLDVAAFDGSRHILRALIDSGSQASFITDQAACALMLRRQHSSINITTFASDSHTRVLGKTVLTMFPRGKISPSFVVESIIVPQITGLTPQRHIVPGNWSHIKTLQLADPSYHIPGPIDLLLGADIIPSLLLDAKVNGNIGEPMAIETVFGWMLMGPVSIQDHSSVASLCLSTSDTLDATLKRFWELEELPVIHHVSPEDRAAEDFYSSTTTRLASGRFMVRLPFRTPSPLLGDSKTSALHRFKALEARLHRDQNLYKQYIDFMQDYLSSRHMELIPPHEKDNPHIYYIPHHCILKPESKTTKLRVVFNASALTTTGTSLNGSLLTGPKLQPDIQVVLLRARLWKYVFMADIRQMYRQIIVHPSDRNYLRIFWRFTPDSLIDEYRLCTVTYGTSAAPFQALRTLREVATVDGTAYPQAASVLLNDTFVDDILTGANSVDEIVECQSQVIRLCSRAQFELRKWVSNSREVLLSVSEDDCAVPPSVLFDSSENSDLKVLGLRWDPVADTLSFRTQPSTTNPSKRTVLSSIARVFDPLGLLSPITFWTKTIMQHLWTSGLTWDDPVPTDILAVWSRYQSELPLLEGLSIPRRLTYDNAASIHLHAFSDSSEKGYAAAVYLRVATTSSVHCQLMIGKSKVAPLKRSTIPRLELCGAVLAAKLLHFVVTTVTGRLKIDAQYAWTDSTTALVWIRSSPHRWTTFIANRTSQIQTLTSPGIWQHVPTQHNPVDCASRGLFPSELINHPLWWTGPPFLSDPPDKWPACSISQPEDMSNMPHFELKHTTLLVKGSTPVTDLLHRFSSLDKILRIIVYCLRFSKTRVSRNFTKVITADEVSLALHSLLLAVQKTTYSNEFRQLSKGVCPKQLLQLDPFIDEAGLLRVGGRLKFANIPYSQRHPVLLPSRHRFTELLIDQHHQQLKHPGATALQSHLQRDYWIQSARRAIRSRLRKCIPCFRTKPRTYEPKMAPLPKYRVQQIKPFSISGVDYAGPIQLKERRGRHSVPLTSYICLFVCAATKALHLELSSDLSTETFLLAFTRFSSRRGPIKEIHSDCGTNFVGAARLLCPLQSLINSETFQTRVQESLSRQQISWHFNPPSSPHFGGLWEAGVKSTKALWLRSVGTHKLTIEEMMTLLTQIEATLNSRPLCASSNDPLDMEALTPSHFLTLEPSTSLPMPQLDNIPLSKLKRWRLITDIHRHFWSRWKSEYLNSLQVRTKWHTNGRQLIVGDLVLIKEATHPLHWCLGRIHALYPGPDGITQVATVKTQSGVLTRPVIKLCPLPIS